MQTDDGVKGATLDRQEVLFGVLNAVAASFASPLPGIEVRGQSLLADVRAPDLSGYELGHLPPIDDEKVGCVHSVGVPREPRQHRSCSVTVGRLAELLAGEIDDGVHP